MYRLACKIFMTAASLGCSAANADSLYMKNQRTRSEAVIIAGDAGGNIVTYAMQAAAYKSAGTTLQVSGNCDSACTIYLSLPNSQICVTPAANFRFHAPMAGNMRAKTVAHQFVRGKYPKWVRSWIDSNGGLTAKLITMDFAFSRKHLPVCAMQTAAR